MSQEYPSLAFMYSECGACHFVSTQTYLDNPSSPCPQCGQPGVRLLFPDLTPAALYDAAVYFQDACERRYQSQAEEMAERIHEEIGRELDASVLLEVSGKISGVYTGAGTMAWAEQTWKSMVQVTAETLALPADVAARACAIIVTTNFAFQEQTAMVVLACAFLETMLSRVLVHVAERGGVPTDQAEDAVDKIRAFVNRKNPSAASTFLGFFQNHTGLSLKQEFERLGHRDFWDDWDQAREDRNDIMHGKLPFAPSDSRERVGRLLAKAIPTFAELQNRYSLTTPTP